MSKEDELKTPETSAFVLKSDAAFDSRVGDVFGSLGNIEAKHNAYQKARSRSRNDSDDDDDDGLLKNDPQDDFLIAPSRGQSDVLLTKPQKSPSEKQNFKRPHPPAPRSRNCPDHKLNPDKWTYYNLEDVSSDSMSERSNTEAAVSFLDSVKPEQPNKKQKLSPDDAVAAPGLDVELSPPKVVFRQPPKKDDVNDTDCHVPSRGRMGVTVMSEYVIGQKTTATRRSRPNKSISASQSNTAVTISHVMDGFDDDDDDDDGSSDADLSLRAKPTRTIFSGCEKEHHDDVKPMDIEQSFFGFLGKKSKTNFKNKTMRHRRSSDSDDDSSKPSSNDKDLDGVD